MKAKLLIIGCIVIGAIVIFLMVSVSREQWLGTTWSRKGGEQIAFIKYAQDDSAELYVLDTTNSTVIQLTQNYKMRYPLWSPDGQRLIFKRSKDEYYVLSLDTGKYSPLQYSNYSTFQHITWSPDGQQIAFDVYDAELRKSLIVMVDADGSNAGVLTEGSRAVWSPNSRQIAYQFSNTVYVTDIEAINPRKIGTGEIPSWSPDGKQIAYAALLGDKRLAAIHIVDADGSNPRMVWQPQEGFGSIRWSPDGERLLFTSNVHDALYGGVIGQDLHLIHVDGTNYRLFDDFQYLMPADWSPDGQYVSYSIYRRVCLYKVGDDKPDCPTRGSFSSVWAPDSKQIAYTLSDSGEHTLCTKSIDGQNQCYQATKSALIGWLRWFPSGK